MASSSRTSIRVVPDLPRKRGVSQESPAESRTGRDRRPSTVSKPKPPAKKPPAPKALVKRKVGGRGAPQLSETLASLELYAFMISRLRPVSTREIIEGTQIPDGTLHPIVAKRVKAGLIHASKRDGVAVFELSRDGYHRAAPMLSRLGVSLADSMRAERFFGGTSDPSTVDPAG